MEPTLTQEQKERGKTFTPQEIERYNAARISGSDPQSAFAYATKSAAPVPASNDGLFRGENSLGSALANAGREIAGGFARVADDVSEINPTELFTNPRAALSRPAVRAAGAAGAATGAVLGGIVETTDDLLTGGRVGRAATEAIQPIVESEAAQTAFRVAGDINTALDEVPGDLLAASELFLPPGIAIAGRTAARGARQVAGEVGEQVSRETARLGDFIAPTRPTPDTPTANARNVAETTAPEVSIGERYVGITPDIKRRVAGKPEKMEEYINVAKTRNVDDTAPTPYEYGASRANQAVTEMETLLNETGGRIGATREKLGTYQATADQIARVDSTFTNQLERLNLEVRNGQIVQKRNAVARASGGDINALNEMYRNLQVVKQSPTLVNLIEFRSAVDSRIKFGKRAAEVSNEVDPLARQIRREVADVGAEIVGKSEAAELARFSEFMDAYNDLRGYTDRAAGGEYLLRLVLSGRGGDARRIIDTIREYTGIDLLDDATMMTLVTDKLGNQAQKNLFRQEITSAGLDVASILTGNPTGVIMPVLRRGADVVFDPEKVLREAAQ